MRCVPWGRADEPPNSSTKPLLAGAKEAARFGTAKLAGFASAIFGRSATASRVTHTGIALAVEGVTLKLEPTAEANLSRPRFASAAAWSCQLSDWWRGDLGAVSASPVSPPPMGRLPLNASNGRPAHAAAARTLRCKKFRRDTVKRHLRLVFCRAPFPGRHSGWGIPTFRSSKSLIFGGACLNTRTEFLKWYAGTVMIASSIFTKTGCTLVMRAAGVVACEGGQR
jgi:hypothetical protein